MKLSHGKKKVRGAQLKYKCTTCNTQHDSRSSTYTEVKPVGSLKAMWCGKCHQLRQQIRVS